MAESPRRRSRLEKFFHRKLQECEGKRNLVAIRLSDGKDLEKGRSLALALLISTDPVDSVNGNTNFSTPTVRSLALIHGLRV